MKHLTKEELEAGLLGIQQSPSDEGNLELIVRRPAHELREVLQEGELNPAEGLVGDNWSTRGSTKTPDGSAHPAKQLTIMNSRVIALLACDKHRWPLAGDQLFVDLDLSRANVPPGTELAIGSAVVEATDQPHTGCEKFVARFGLDAVQFVNSTVGRDLQLRRINARVVRAGVIRVGDVVKKSGRSGLRR